MKAWDTEDGALRNAEQRLADAAYGVRGARRSLNITYTCLGINGFFGAFTLARIIGLVPPHSTSWFTIAAAVINVVAFASIAGLVLPANRRLIRKAGERFVKRENVVMQMQRDGQR